MNEESIRIAANIRKSLHAEIRIWCFQSGVKVQDALNEAMEEWMDRRRGNPVSGQASKVGAGNVQ
jgi:hypothetical protein